MDELPVEYQFVRLVAGAVCFALLGFVIVILVLDALFSSPGLLGEWVAIYSDEREREREMTLEVGISP